MHILSWSAGPTLSYILFCGSGKAKKEWCCETLHRGCEWGAKPKHGLSRFSVTTVTTEKTRCYGILVVNQIGPKQRNILELSLIRIGYFAKWTYAFEIIWIVLACISLSSLRFQTGDTNSSSFELAITSLWHPVANNSNSTKTWHESAFQMLWQAGWHALGNPVWSLRDLTPKTIVETQNFKNLQDKDRKWMEMIRNTWKDTVRCDETRKDQCEIVWLSLHGEKMW